MAANDIPTYDAVVSFVTGFLGMSLQANPTATDGANINAIATAIATQVDTALAGIGGAGVNANRALHMYAIVDAFVHNVRFNAAASDIQEAVVTQNVPAALTTAATYAAFATTVAQAYHATITNLQ